MAGAVPVQAPSSCSSDLGTGFGKTGNACRCSGDWDAGAQDVGSGSWTLSSGAFPSSSTSQLSPNYPALTALPMPRPKQTTPVALTGPHTPSPRSRQDAVLFSFYFFIFVFFLPRLLKFSELKPKKAEGEATEWGKKEAKVMFCQKKKKGGRGG